MHARSQNFALIIFIFSVAVIGGGGCSLGQAKSDTAKAESLNTASESDQAMRSALELIQRVPDSTLGYNQVAILHIQKARRTGDFGLNKKAEIAVDRALELSPDDVPSRKLKASLLLTFHRFDEALAAGKELDRDDPNDAFVYGVLTDANTELGNYDEAIAAAQRMVDLKPNASSYARVAHLRSLFGDHAGAVKMYTTAVQITDPKDVEAQSWGLVQLGDEYYRNGNFKKAESVYDEALSILPDYHLAIAAKGKIRAAFNDLDAAESFLTRVVNTVPNVDSAILLGDLYAKRGDLDRARSQYDLAELLENRIGISTDQKRLAMMWADQDRKIPEALEIATKEFGVRKDIYTADTLAWAQYKSGQFSAAKDSITQAMRTKVNDARISFHAGMIENASGNRKDAIKLLSSAIKLNPSFDLLQADTAKRTLAELLRGDA